MICINLIKLGLLVCETGIMWNIVDWWKWSDKISLSHFHDCLVVLDAIITHQRNLNFCSLSHLSLWPVFLTLWYCFGFCVIVPLSIYMFTLPLPYLGIASSLPPGFVAGAIVLLIGLLIYCRTPSVEATSDYSPSLIHRPWSSSGLSSSIWIMESAGKLLKDDIYKSERKKDEENCCNCNVTNICVWNKMLWTLLICNVPAVLDIFSFGALLT